MYEPVMFDFIYGDNELEFEPVAFESIVAEEAGTGPPVTNAAAIYKHMQNIEVYSQ